MLSNVEAKEREHIPALIDEAVEDEGFDRHVGEKLRALVVQGSDWRVRMARRALETAMKDLKDLAIVFIQSMMSARSRSRRIS